jgi:hemerythrin-like domain-containing protein
MSTVIESINFAELDACHQQMKLHLTNLEALALAFEARGSDAQVKAQAQVIESFFSGAARKHHQQEETEVFPVLLAQGHPELADLILTLKQDHGWIEENWIELAPQLRAIASGNFWFEASEFQHGVEVFLDLCRNHMGLEETRVYPQVIGLLGSAKA